jgi:hypothetical protein
VARRRPSRSKLARRAPSFSGSASHSAGGCASAPPRARDVARVSAAYALLERNWQSFHDLRTRAEITIRQTIGSSASMAYSC